MLQQLLAIPGPVPPGVAASIIGEGESDDFICHPIHFPSAMDVAECRAAVALGEGGRGFTAGLTRPVEGYRTGVTRVIALTRESRWLYERIGEIVVSVNHWYRYDVTGFV